MLLSISPTLVSIISDTPNEGDLITNGMAPLHQAPQQLTFRFDSGQTIDASTLATGLQIVRSGNDGVFGNGNDVVVATGFVGLPDKSNEVVVRFLNSLPDDTYRLTVVGAGAGALKNTQGQAFNNGANSVTTFRLDLGAQVVSVVPQPITRNASGQLVQAANQIAVYFNGDTLNTASAQDTSLYQLIDTKQTATNSDDAIVNPISVAYNPATNSAVLTFLPGILTSTSATTFRLRIGDNSTTASVQTINAASDAAGSSFDTAMPVGLLGNQTKVLTGAALDAPGNFSIPFDGLIWPGGPTDPGQRDIPAQSHINGFAFASSTSYEQNGIVIQPYNFQSNIGTVNGNPVFNQITEAQKQRVREVFEMYGHYLGIQFVETPSAGFTIATGDLRVVSPTVPTGPGGVAGIADGVGEAVMDNAENWGNSEFGGSYFQVAMHEIGHLLGLGHSYEAPPLTIQGSEGELASQPAEPVFPGDFDLLGAQNLFPPNASDIDVYSFTLNTSGRFTAETVAERLSSASLANTVITLFDSQGNIIARNDDYFSSDSFVDLNLSSGTYYVAVTSTGNTNFNPKVENSGAGGTTDGPYTLRLNFVSSSPGVQMVDTTGTALDGDADGTPGGDYNFWFNVAATSTTASQNHTLFVDKAAPNGGDGTLAHPFNNLQSAIQKAGPASSGGDGVFANGLGDVIRVVGNGGADNNVSTLADDKAYQIGYDIFNQPLSDGATLNVPKGVTLMVDAGAVFKLRQATINAGTISQGIDLSRGSIQVLGTPFQKAYFTSYNNEAIGLDTNPLATTPTAGDWSGFVFRNDSDQEAQGIFVNYLAFADIGYGGGASIVDSVSQTFDAIDMITARPTLYYNSIHDSAGAAISADPDSFEESLYNGSDAPSGGTDYTADYRRIGPAVHGNVVQNNSINGLFVRIRTNAGTPIDVLTKTARFNATDIVYVITENLWVNGAPGGPTSSSNTFSTSSLTARLDASLAIDPGVVVKLQGARIEVGLGAQLIAEGTAGKPVVFTSLSDDTYGAGGVYDTTGDGTASIAAPGDWGGLDFDPISNGSIDHAVIAYAGGVTPIEGGFARFNPVEIRQATVRLTNSTLENNASGGDTTDRNGRGATVAATIFVRGAQPILVDNLIRNNAGDAISINANAMIDTQVVDWGRATGLAQLFTQYSDNYGPMVRGNIVMDNDINGMAVRGATLTRGTLWDDTDIVHVLRDNIDVPNFESIGGLRLQSSPTASLVVKLFGAQAGFTADGQPLDIQNRIGGSVQILGTPGHAVILTSLNDSTVGAGFDLNGNPQTQTLGNGLPGADAASKLKINFIAGPGIAANAPALAVFKQAAAAWEAVLDDPVTLTFDIDMQSLGANILGLTSSVETSLNYDDVRAHMIADARSNEAIVSQLPTFAQLQENLPAGVTKSPNMTLSNANALALGYQRSALTQTASAFNPSQKIDATIEFTTDFNFDFDRSDGLTGQDFLATVIHEIGHALGFFSSVDNLDGGATTFSPTPLDLFRLSPGAGATNFTTAPRAVTPGQTAVFYDGGQFNNASLGLTPFSVGDIPMSTGVAQGDGFQASHWLNRDQIPSATPIGIMDPVVFPFGTITQADTRAMDLIGWNAVNRGSPGDWNGIDLTQYSNDRNVPVINELEPTYTGIKDTNNTPATAQFLGTLAASQQSTDESRRLGFEVHGAISFDQPGDADVYSFSGVAGTQIWLDIDKTSTSLDTVLELIDAGGNVLAQSDNSDAEDHGLGLPFVAQGIQANTLTGSEFSNGDLYTTNLKDAGFRVVLPGTLGATNNYYVRVRSGSANLDNLTGGQTSGRYQLQIRLQEVDEIPGSAVSFADIRFANNGITVKGLPDASPLTSTSTNSTGNAGGFISNTTFDTAQDIGNLLDSDQNMLSVSSALLNAADVDWFKFTLDYQQLQSIQGLSDGGLTWATLFDIDYADGLSRPDTTLSVFDSLGNLIYISRGSNNADDQPSSLNPSSQSDLSRGSSGGLDPWLGTIHLPEGASKTYYVAISSNASIPNILIHPTPPGAPHLEPVDGLTRVVEDHIGSVGYTSSPTATQPDILPTTPAILPINPQLVANPNPAFPGTTTQQIGLNIVPYTLSDLQLFVSQDLVTPATTQQRLLTVNPATGATNATVGNLGGVPNGVRDIAIRSDGILMGVQDQTSVPATAAQLTAVDPTTGQLFVVGQDKIPDYVPPPPPQPGQPPATSPRDQLTASSVGAIAYQYIGLGNAYTNGDALEPYFLYEAVNGDNGTGIEQSYLYLANPLTGNAAKDDANLYTQGPVGGSVRQADGLAGPNSLAGIYQTTGGDMGITNGMAFANPNGTQLNIPAGSSITDAQFFSVTDAYRTVTFQFQHVTAGVPDGAPLVAGRVAIQFTGTETAAQMAVLVQTALNNSELDVHVEVSANANLPVGVTRIVVNNALSAVVANSPLTVTAMPSGNILFGVSDTGKFYSIATDRGNWKLGLTDPNTISGAANPNVGLATLVHDFGNLNFTGLAQGPQNLDLDGDGVGGDLANTLFAITKSGDIYAIDPVSGTFRMDVFKNAQGQPVDHISTNIASATGLAFSPLDINLWHPTNQASGSAGHGIMEAPDNSRSAAGGGSSYYFGYENFGGGYLTYQQNTRLGLLASTTQYGVNDLGGLSNSNQQFDLTRNSVLSGGTGAAAAGMSLPFSAGFTGSDTLRANEMVGNNYNTPGGAHGDLISNSFSLSGYAAADLPTVYINYYADSTDGMSISASADGGAHWTPLGGSIVTATSTGGVLDTTWRQFRADLSSFAGQSDIKLKFSFSAGIADNNHKGFMIDDIIVGFAERGEMVTGAHPQTDFYTSPPATNYFPPNSYVETPVKPGMPSQVLVGPYQLSIRRGDEYEAIVSQITGRTVIFNQMDTNDRSINGFTLQAPGAYALFAVSSDQLADGQKFTLTSDGVTKTFEFDTGNGVGSTNGVANTAILIVANEDANAVGRRIVQAINGQAKAPTLVTPAGNAYSDGNVFSISDTSKTIQFWFHKFGSGQPVPSNVFEIDFSGGETAQQMATLITKSINQSGLNVVAAVSGGIAISIFNSTNISVGSSPLFFQTGNFNVPATLDPSGQGRVYLTGITPANSNFSGTPNLKFDQDIKDGDTFYVSDGVNFRYFEFDNNNSLDFADDVAVPFSSGDTPATIAATIATIINGLYGPNFKVSATSTPTNDRVNLFGAAFVSEFAAPGLVVDRFQARGDQNTWRPQGEVILQGNQITDAAKWGIQILPGDRDGTGAHPGSAAVLANVNSQRLAPGLVVQNNIIDSAGVGGILYSGDPNGANLPNALVPFGRIINNTIYGAGFGVGISVTNNASPTLLNNIVASLTTGISVDATSATTVVGGTLYQGNTTNVSGTALGSFAITQSAGAPLFVNADGHNFNLLKSNASGLPNQAIDSSVNTLQDRQSMITIDSPIGISVSPILAPTTDLTGKVRVDDPTVNPPFSGLGSNVFIDRGALDRSDFTGPQASLLNPVDNDAASTDQDPAPNSVVLAGQTLADFRIQLNDGTGTGIDDSTVVATAFTLTRNGIPLVLGTDYTFGYDATNKVVKFTPVVGIWQSNFVYVITVDNSLATGIKDLAGNQLLPTDVSGVTKFTITLIPVDFGDAPSPYPTVFADNGARHVLSDGLWLGATVTSESNGQPSPDANSDPGDDGVVFNSVITPGTTATITVTATQAGKLDAWIDWGADGSWNEAGDQVFVSQQLVAGANVLHFNVPSTVATTTYARFRVSTAGGLAPTGLAVDGEVEDYKVSIAPPVAYTTKLYNAATGVELPKDSTGEYVALAGTTVQARVFVTDIRGVGAAGGVFSAFADLTRDNSGITWGSLVISPNFPNVQSGSIDVGNQIVDEAGGVAGLSPTGAQTPTLLFTVNGTIDQSVVPGTVINVTPDPADQTLAHPTLVYGAPDAVGASYTGAKMIIPIHPWQNPVNNLDVDASGSVVPLDALLIINKLNQGLGGPLPQSPVPPNIPPPYLDVNGDGNLTPLDALLIISFLNQQAPLMAGGAPPSTPAAATAGGAPPTQVVALADSAPQQPASLVANPTAVSAATATVDLGNTTADTLPFDATPISASLTLSQDVVASTVVGSNGQAATMTAGAVLSVAQAAADQSKTSRVDGPHVSTWYTGVSGTDQNALRERVLAQLFSNSDDSDALELADVGPRLENAWNQAKNKWRHG